MRIRGTAQIAGWLAGGIMLAGVSASAMGQPDPAEALEQLRSGDRGPLEELAGHPAEPWLQKAYYRERLEETDPEEVGRFLWAHRDAPFADELRADWLRALGETEQWQAFLTYYSGQDETDLRCYQARARLAGGNEYEAFRAARHLWNSGRPRPAACKPLFEAAREAGEIQDRLVAERFQQALEQQHYDLAGELADYATSEDRKHLDQERRLQQQPRRVLEEINPAEADTDETRRYVKALTRLARDDAGEARERWAQAHRQGLEPEAEDRRRFQRRVAIAGAQQHHPNAHIWLAASSADDALIQTWRVRNALRRLDWEAVIAEIEGLPGWRQQSNWRYWHARALKETGDTGDALRALEALAERENFYGLLAARALDRAEMPLRNGESLESDAQRQAELAGEDGIQAARFLWEADWPEAARAEWNRALRRAPANTACQAADKARGWGWASKAAVTAARNGCRGDPEIDYPLVQRERMQTLAEELDIDSAWAWGMMRAESLFRPDVRSPAGAVGIMQLMPTTAQYMATAIGRPMNGEDTLTDPAANLELGLHYLAQLSHRFDDHPVVAAAAYNAGPNRVRTWLPENADLPAEVWMETIPFRETRRYVRRIVLHSLGFDQRLENGEGALDQRLAPVRANPRLALCDPESRMSRAPTLPEAC